MKRRSLAKVSAAVMMIAALATTAQATPGAVNAQGCHGKHGRMGYHCHGHNSTMKFSTKNQRFVPFGRG